MTTAALLLSVLLQGDRPDLIGTVTGDDGQPVAGAAVFIHTARVKTGVSTICPGCHPDGGKHATTARDGGFRIPSLDPRLLFQVLVVGDGYEPAFAENVDPADGPLSLVVKRRAELRIPSERVIRGRVVNQEGRPVVGAVVTPRWFDTERSHGIAPGVFDPRAVTDVDGRFLIVSKEVIESASFHVEVPRMAPTVTDPLRPGEEHVLRLDPGSFVAGRAISGGKPLAGVTIGLAQTDTDARSVLFRRLEIGTDEQGDFLFSNVPSNREYVLFGVMAGMADGAAIPVTRIRVGEGTTEIGVLKALRGHRLSGRIALTDGKPLPSGLRLFILREEAVDALQAEVDGAGRFVAEGLPPERYSIAIRTPGYRLSDRNRSLDPVSRQALVGRISAHVEDFSILLEPGETERRKPGPPAVEKLRLLRESPLEGAGSVAAAP